MEWDFYKAVKEGRTSEVNHFHISLFSLEKIITYKKTWLSQKKQPINKKHKTQ